MRHQLEAIDNEQPKFELPALGTRFTVKATVEKVHDPESEIWVRWMRRQLSVSKPMMFIGVRQVKEGLVVDHEKIYHDSEGMGVDVDYTRMFQATRVITVWLFVATAHSKPVHVLPSDAEAVG